MSNTLRISLLQPDLHWEDPAANRRWLEEQFGPLAGRTDLVVMPEMFTTGFTMQAAAHAEPARGTTFEWMRQWAERLQAALTGSIIVEEDGRYFNRLIWMEPDGTCHTYDKRHLFTLAGEHEHYSPGRERLIVNYRGWRILPLICYDLRFPVWSRNRDDYDMLIYVANFPALRQHAWRSLLTARAIENQAFTVAVNRVGRDANDYDHAGDSGIIDYQGQWRVKLHGHPAVHTQTIALEEQQAFRRRFAFLADRDEFSLTIR